jgi:hypothetical protein
LAIDLSPDRFSTLLKERTILVSGVDVFLHFKSQKLNDDYQPTPISATLSAKVGEASPPARSGPFALESDPILLAGTPQRWFDLPFEVSPGVETMLTLEIDKASLAALPPLLVEAIPGSPELRLKPDVVDNVSFLLRYSVK